MILHGQGTYAASKATLQYPFVLLGMCSECGSSLLLPKWIGHQNAQRLFMTGEKITALQALSLGIVNEIYGKNELYQRTYEQAEKIAKQPLNALIAQKQLLRYPYAKSLKSVLRQENRAVLKLFFSSETRQRSIAGTKALT